MDSKSRKWRWCATLYLIIAALQAGHNYQVHKTTMSASVALGLVVPAYLAVTIVTQDYDTVSRLFPNAIFWRGR